MRIEFKEEFSLPAHELHRYFKSPADRPRLYGAFGAATDRGFWRCEGEVTFSQSSSKMAVDGYKDISMCWLFMFSLPIEKLLIERKFKKVWRYG